MGLSDDPENADDVVVVAWPIDSRLIDPPTPVPGRISVMVLVYFGGVATRYAIVTSHTAPSAVTPVTT